MNGYYWHVLVQGSLFGIAITLLLGAYHLWTIRRIGSDRQVNEKILFWCMFSGAVVGAVVLGSWAVHNELHHHRTFIVDNLLAGDSHDTNGSVLFLGLIAIVMTLATAGVVTIARHSITDIRREKEGLHDDFDVLKKQVRDAKESLRGDFDLFRDHLLRKQEAEMHISLLRLDILDQTKQELKAMCLSGEEGGQRYQFRSALEACYSKWDSIPFDPHPGKLPPFLEHLDKAYDRNVHGRLLDSEYTLLEKLKKYYTKYKLDEREKVADMIDDILRR